jgi:hypothetical protein
MKLYTAESSLFLRKHVNYLSLLLSVVACVAAISGCASSMSYQQHDKTNVQPVLISKEVPLPTMYYQGFGDVSMGAFFGLSGLLVEMIENSNKEVQPKPVDVVTYVLKKNKIDIREIVLKEFEKQIKASNLFSEIATEGENYPKFNLSILMYGFAQPHGLSKQLKPQLNLLGVLVNPDKSILWWSSAFVTNLSGQTTSHTLEEYLTDPELMREAFNRASEVVVTDLVNHLKGD